MEEINYLPSKLFKIGKEFQKYIQSIFSYQINFLNPDNKNLDKIIRNYTCPRCNNRLHVSDCFHKKNSLKVTFLRFCHNCGVIFLFSGRFEIEREFDNSFNYFNEHIYNKKINEID